MARMRLVAEDIAVGTPLRYDVFDAQGRMLLCAGYVIESAGQIERLIEHGLFSDASAVRQARGTGSEPADAVDVGVRAARPALETMSAIDLVVEARRRLGSALAVPADASAALVAVRDAAIAVEDACRYDSDAALATILVLRDDPYPIRHAVDVALLGAILSKELGHAESVRRAIVCAALTMNVAMTELQITLYAQAAPLDDAQRRALVAHPVESARWLESGGLTDRLWLDIVAQHHEAADGSGYPARLHADDIRPEAQVVSLADRYCGMVSERAYRAGASPTAALREIYLRHGAAIDPKLIGLLVKEMGIYPPGTAVELANGELGVVVRRTLNPGQPIVRALRTAEGRPLPGWPKRVTADPIHAVRGVHEGRTRELGADARSLWPATVQGP